MHFKSKYILLIGILLVLFSISSYSHSSRDFTDYVNPFIGTGGHGHTYPGATMPFGMTQLSPDTRLTGWDGCSGYHYSDSVVYGFSHTHLSGTGISDYADILFMPTVGEVQFNNGYQESPESGYGSQFSHDREQAEPGYYAVDLLDYDVRAELTVTPRTGMQRYTFPESDSSNIILDLEHRDRVINGKLEIVNDSTIRGIRVSRSWASEQHVYFYTRFSRPFDDYTLQVDGEEVANTSSVDSKHIKVAFHFDTEEDEQIMLKTGISAVDMNGAQKNLKTENENWNFGNIRRDASRKWEEELSKIEVTGGSTDRKTIFYTALYHSLLAPNLFSDVDGRYRGHDMKIHETDDHNMYTVFSLWDTFRATHPLFTLIQQEKTNEFINTFLKIYEQGGKLPVWELAANETNTMIGYHAIPVIADAYRKGIRGYDAEKALKAMVHSAKIDNFGRKYYQEFGFIPSGEAGESVSKTLEYAYDDWCIARMAKDMDKTSRYEEFIERAQSYKNLYDKDTDFFRAKVNGGWYKPFDPTEVNFNYTEANAWQYRFFVPQDVQGLIELMGGRKTFNRELDKMFTAKEKTSGRHQADITGLIGQYAHGNEPSHHMAYLYNYSGKAWKTQKIVHRIMKEMYTNTPDGLSGNEDCGQMSSWLVQSAMGFYSVTPGKDYYTIGTPHFKKVTMHLENGNDFVVKAENISEDNFFIQSATLNGQKYTKGYLPHDKIMKGDTLTFKMGSEPNKEFASGKENIPHSSIKKHHINSVPYVAAGSRTFEEKDTIRLASSTKGSVIYYTLDGSEPDKDAKKYESPIEITDHTNLKMRSFHPKYGKTKVVTAHFRKIPKNLSVELKSEYSNMYSGGGDDALIDQIRGSNNYRTGNWQGYQGKDVEAIVDLGEEKAVNELSLGCLQDVGSWIFLPEQVEFYVSRDKEEFRKVEVVDNPVPLKKSGPLVHDFKASIDANARYVKVVAKTIGKCPEWHKGAGGKAWIFVDEIEID